MENFCTKIFSMRSKNTDRFTNIPINLSSDGRCQLTQSLSNNNPLKVAL